MGKRDLGGAFVGFSVDDLAPDGRGAGRVAAPFQHVGELTQGRASLAGRRGISGSLEGSLGAAVVADLLQEEASPQHRPRGDVGMPAVERCLQHGLGAGVVAEPAFEHAAEHRHGVRRPVRVACGDALLPGGARGLVVAMALVRLAQLGERLGGDARLRRSNGLLVQLYGALVIPRRHPPVRGEPDQGAPVPGVNSALERGPGQFRLIEPQQVTQRDKVLAVTGLKLLPVIPGQHLSHRGRQAGISFQDLLDRSIQLDPRIAASRLADLDRGRRRDARACFRAAEDQPGQLAAHSLRLRRIGLFGPGQHAVAIGLDRPGHEPGGQVSLSHPASSRAGSNGRHTGAAMNAGLRADAASRHSSPQCRTGNMARLVLFPHSGRLATVP